MLRPETNRRTFPMFWHKQVAVNPGWVQEEQTKVAKKSKAQIYIHRWIMKVRIVPESY